MHISSTTQKNYCRQSPFYYEVFLDKIKQWEGKNYRLQLLKANCLFFPGYK